MRIVGVGKTGDVSDRLPLVDPDDPSIDETTRAVLQAVRERSGRDWNVYRAIANHDEVFQGFLRFGAAAYSRNSLTPQQRELAYLSASVANDCFY